MNTITLNSGLVCWHDRATRTVGPTTHQINWYCPDCGYTRTTYPPPFALPQEAPPAAGAAQAVAQSTIDDLVSKVRWLRCAVRDDCGAGASREAFNIAVAREDELIAGIRALAATPAPDALERLRDIVRRYEAGYITERGFVDAVYALKVHQ